MFGRRVNLKDDTKPVVQKQTDGLNDLLMSLSMCGEPQVRYVSSEHIGGWKASIQLKVSHAGGVFSVESEYKHATPLDAIAQLSERVLACVESPVLKKA